jgi:hypothetical protein
VNLVLRWRLKIESRRARQKWDLNEKFLSGDAIQLQRPIATKWKCIVVDEIEAASSFEIFNTGFYNQFACNLFKNKIWEKKFQSKSFYLLNFRFGSSSAAAKNFSCHSFNNITSASCAIVRKKLRDRFGKV